MADTKVEKTSEVAEECPLKEKKVKDTTEKEESKDEKPEEDDKIENGDVKEKNGKQEAEEDKDVCEKTACKRKSAGGDAPDGTPAEETETPEKKQKTQHDAVTEEDDDKTEEVTA